MGVSARSTAFDCLYIFLFRAEQTGRRRHYAVLL